MPLPAAAFPCCRGHDLYGPVEEYGQAIQRGFADEAYWFNWVTEGSGEGGARIRIAPLGGEAMFFRVYRPSNFGKRRRSHGAVSSADWARVEDAVVRSRFWLLDEHEASDLRLGDARWCFAGRRLATMLRVEPAL
jgi:hypothetical protein